MRSHASVSFLVVLLLFSARHRLAALGAAEYGGCAGTVPETVIDATPADYRARLATLGPGDLLRLAPGTYGEGLPFNEHHGEAGRCTLERKSELSIFADGFESDDISRWSNG